MVELELTLLLANLLTSHCWISPNRADCKYVFPRQNITHIYGIGTHELVEKSDERYIYLIGDDYEIYFLFHDKKKVYAYKPSPSPFSPQKKLMMDRVIKSITCRQPEAVYLLHGEEDSYYAIFRANRKWDGYWEPEPIFTMRKIFLGGKASHYRTYPLWELRGRVFHHILTFLEGGVIEGTFLFDYAESGQIAVLMIKNRVKDDYSQMFPLFEFKDVEIPTWIIRHHLDWRYSYYLFRNGLKGPATHKLFKDEGSIDFSSKPIFETSIDGFTRDVTSLYYDQKMDPSRRYFIFDQDHDAWQLELPEIQVSGQAEIKASKADKEFDETWIAYLKANRPTKFTANSKLGYWSVEVGMDWSDYKPRDGVSMNDLPSDAQFSAVMPRSH